MSRKLKISVEPNTGAISRVYVFVDGTRRIAEDGDKKCTWSGEVSDEGVTIKTRVFGVGEATYVMKIDLPGTIKDQSLTISLQGGYHEAEYTV